MSAGRRAPFPDRLAEACHAKGAPFCVGLDPVLERLPSALRGADPVSCLEHFSMRAVRAVSSAAAAVKIQLACFERYGPDGWAAAARVASSARAEGLLVILDAKRGDIAESARHYAEAHLRDPSVDALTVQSWFGLDGLLPFLEVASEEGKGVYALVRATNPSADGLQGAQLAEGGTVAERAAEEVASAAAEYAAQGASGYRALGAVVGATRPEEASALRRHMPAQPLLVPGLGAQGGSAKTLGTLFDARGDGALLTASRSVLYAFAEEEVDWESAIARAAHTHAEEAARAEGVRRA